MDRPFEQIRAAPHPDDRVRTVYVQFTGLKRVTPQVLVAECGALRHARTLGEVDYALRHSMERLEELGLFKSVHPEVTLSPRGDVDIEFFAEERKRQFTVGGNVDKLGELTADVKLEQPALLGGPLSVTASASSTVNQAHEFLLKFSTPRIGVRRCSSSFEVARTGTEETVASSFGERTTHATWRCASPGGGHSVAVQAALRDVMPGGGKGWFPSVEIQQARLCSVKTSVSYSFAWSRHFATVLAPWTLSGGVRGAAGAAPAVGNGNADIGDGEVFGAGTSVRGGVEAAGVGGDAKFLRGEATAGLFCMLPGKGFRCGFAASCGALLPTDGRPTCLQDRFFVGGASGSTLMLKGFGHRGIGPAGARSLRKEAPHEASSDAAEASDRPAVEAIRPADALGGDAMLNANFSVSAPLPFNFSFGGIGDTFARASAGVTTNAGGEGAGEGTSGDGRVGDSSGNQSSGGSSPAHFVAVLGVGTLAPRANVGVPTLWRDLRQGLRASAAVGVGMPLGGGTLEMTFAVPFWAQRYDMRQRLQLGLRLNVETG
eukprot:TRINITY_DN43872_c0_g1_i1.p1 TRINITY_DN43872_c0_g1~~TRINITY_DN43872_c0_g1_i1.p1  ORF type:complete len:558 (+),score=99.59 TRINITY_DN43872_c0_g1_i1:40-1674(+)